MQTKVVVEIDILVAMNPFKGTLTSRKLASIIRNVMTDRGHNVTTVTMSDGGDGFTEAVSDALKTAPTSMKVTGPTGKPVMGHYVLKDTKAWIGFSEASGLSFLDEDERNPMETTSYGTGLMIWDAVRQGARTVTLGLGGSATNDAGFGMVQALGVTFRDSHGVMNHPIRGRDLKDIMSVDLSSMDPVLNGVKFHLLSDVKNPLLGENGASLVFAPQKGADALMALQLEESMRHVASLLARMTERHTEDVPGAGAAGGAGFGAMALLGARMLPGTEAMIGLTDLDRLIIHQDMVIVGEGRLDNQTQEGKAPYGIALLARRYGVAVTGLFGSVQEGTDTSFLDFVGKVVTDTVTTDDALSDPEGTFQKLVMSLGF